MKTVFLSFAREDLATASRLATDLQNRLAQVWFDRNLASNDLYIEEILRQISLADHMVVLLSNASRKSLWVAFEAGATRARDHSEGSQRIHLLSLDGKRSQPDYFKGLQVTSIKPSEYQTGLRTLCRAIGIPEHVDFKAPAGRNEESLQIFRAGGQWMELIASTGTLSCVLVDAGEQRARIQWIMEKDELQGSIDNLEVQKPKANRSWGTFSIGMHNDWRWSPALFKSKTHPRTSAAKIFKDRVKELIRTTR